MAEGRFASDCKGGSIKESVCISANKVYDSCKGKDCLENLRVRLTVGGQAIFDRANAIKAKTAEIIGADIDVTPVPFNKGFFTVDITYYIKVFFDACVGGGRPQCIEGLVTANKRVILFGSEGGVKTFTSGVTDSCDITCVPSQNSPKCTVDAADPIILNSCAVQGCDDCGCPTEVESVPDNIGCFFEDALTDGNEYRKLIVSLGLFSIIRLERSVQILVPSYDFCIPEQRCNTDGEEQPCTLFDRISFPTNEFFPLRFSDFARENGLDNGGNNDGCCR